MKKTKNTTKSVRAVERVPFIAYLDTEIYEALRREAYDAHVSMSAIVRQTIAEKLNIKL